MTVSNIASWKIKPEELEVPSGNICLVRRKPLEAFIKSGQIPNALLPILRESIRSGGKEEAAMEAIRKIEWTEEQMKDLFELQDAVVVDCVVEPKVFAEPEHGEQRDPELLYVDEISFEDKSTIYTFAISGVREQVESFRGQSEGDVGSVPAMSSVPGSTSEPEVATQ